MALADDVAIEPGSGGEVESTCVGFSGLRGDLSLWCGAAYYGAVAGMRAGAV